MSIKNYLTMVLLLIASLGSAQEKWEELCNEKPQTALAEAKKMYNKALQESNTPELIQALIIQIRCKTLINADSFPVMLTRVENMIGQSSNKVEKSILHSLLAEFYQEYYLQNAYRINQRTSLSGTVPPDMEEWSGNLFIQQIFNHALAALEPRTELQETNTDNYHVLLIAGEDSKTLRPTLYDFISHRSIAQIQQCRHNITSNFFKQHEITNPGILSSLNNFLRFPVQVYSFDIQSNILKIYQDLLRFRKSNPNEAALIVADLERLEYSQSILHQDSFYLKSLQTLYQEFQNSPYSTEVLYQEALQYQLTGNEPEIPGNIEKVLALCRKGIEQYPSYKRIGLLKNLIAQVENPELNVNFSTNIYPGKSQNFQFSYKNIGKVIFTLYKIEETTNNYNQKKRDKKEIRREQLFQKSYSLPQILLRQDTSFSIPIHKSGLYEISVSTPNQKAITKSFICNSLFTTTRQAEQRTFEFMVRDGVTGKPLPNASIILYSYRNGNNTYNSILKADSILTTNKNGMATFTIPKMAKHYRNVLYYETINRENPNGYINSQYYYDNNYEEASRFPDISLFTDRQVYRPGQSVLFSGISWKAEKDSLFILEGQKYSVNFTNNQQNKIIVTQSVITNSWGSFSGSFSIPSNAPNGSYSLNIDNFSTNIEVAEYKRPEIEVTIDPQEGIYAFGDPIHVSGKVNTYSGIRLADSQLAYQISLKTMYRWQNTNEVIQHGQLVTDIDGNFDLRFQTESPKQSISSIAGGYFYEVIISATDSKGETQESSAIIRINKQPYSLVIRMPEYINQNISQGIRIGAYNAGNIEVPEKINYIFYRLAPLTGPEQSYSTENARIESIILQGSLSTRTDSITPDFKNWSSGAYLLKTFGTGIKNDSIIEKKIFYLYSVNDKRPPILTYNWLIEEKTHCKPGENAEILFGTSAKDTYVLYELFDNKKSIKRVQLKLSDEIIHLQIPYKKEYGSDICLLLSFVKDGRLFSNEIRIYKEQPDKILHIKTTVFRDKLKPGEKEQWQFRVENGQGQPVLSEVMAVMYDQSLDKLQPNNWYFYPVVFQNTFCSPWENSIRQEIESIYFNIYNRQSSIAPFRFDVLNLYNSNHLRRAEIMASGSLSENLVTRDAGIFQVKNAMYSKQMDGQAKDEVMQESTTAAATPPFIRENFQETAFFFPQLQTNRDGVVTIRFTVPDATTRWKFMALAHTKDLKYGYTQKEITTTKELTVAPNLPRFFRSEDQCVIKADIRNLSDAAQNGKATFELFIPSTNEIILKQEVNFETKANQHTTVSFGFKVPSAPGVIGCRTIATTPDFSDGEQQLVAILPDRVLLTESLPIFTMKEGKQIFRLSNSSPTKTDYRLTFELTANPIWYGVLALPSLQEPQSPNATNLAAAFYVNTVGAFIAHSNPLIAAAIKTWDADNNNKTTLLSQLEQNSSLKSILIEATPWVMDAQNETERMQSLSQLFDANRLSYLQEQSLQGLTDLQNPDGGWSWFKGGESDRFITANILILMSRANTTGQKEYGYSEKQMQIDALRFLDNAIKKDYAQKDRPRHIYSNQLLYLYARSMYRDIPIADALEAHKYYISLVEKQWMDLSFYEKALSASTLWRYGITETAKGIVNSLKEYATITADMGMYWANNNSANTVNSSVSTQTAILEAFYQIKGRTPETDLMKQWLLRQKQTQNWGSVPGSIDAIYALLLTGNHLLDQGDTVSIAIGKDKLSSSSGNSFFGYIQTLYSAQEITPDMSTVVLDKEHATPTWGALYLQYFDKLQQVRKQKNPVLNIEKQLFVERNTENGKELVPAEKAIRTGDKIIVRLTVKADRDMQYVHIQDLRAACLEPAKQLSGNQWKDGVSYYQETKDATTNFFFHSLPKGSYVFEYAVWVSQEGTYQDGLATIQCIYAPEFVSHSLTRNIHVSN